jgi:hypothetical protein
MPIWAWRSPGTIKLEKLVLFCEVASTIWKLSDNLLRRPIGGCTSVPFDFEGDARKQVVQASCTFLLLRPRPLPQNKIGGIMLGYASLSRASRLWILRSTNSSISFGLTPRSRTGLGGKPLSKPIRRSEPAAVWFVRSIAEPIYLCRSPNSVGRSHWPSTSS